MRLPTLHTVLTLATLGVIACRAGVADAAVTCTVKATAPAFGTYNPLSGTPDDSNGSITVTCKLSGTTTTTVNATIALSTGSSGSFLNRTMLAGVQPLDYNLYEDSTYTSIWGDGTGTTVTVTDTFVLTTTDKSQTTTSTIYGQIPAGESNVAAGSFSDTITVTVSY